MELPAALLHDTVTMSRLVYDTDPPRWEVVESKEVPRDEDEDSGKQTYRYYVPVDPEDPSYKWTFQKFDCGLSFVPPSYDPMPPRYFWIDVEPPKSKKDASYWAGVKTHERDIERTRQHLDADEGLKDIHSLFTE